MVNTMGGVGQAGCSSSQSGGLVRPADLTRRTGRPKRHHDVPSSRSPRGPPLRVSGDRLTSQVHRDMLKGEFSERFPQDVWTGGLQKVSG